MLASLYILINQINRLLSHKQFVDQVVTTKRNMAFINKLYQLGIIKTYNIRIQTSNNITVQLVLNKSRMNKITIWSKPSRRIFVDTKQLIKLYKIMNKIRSHFVLISTVHGIISSEECLIYGCGGEIICSL